MANLQNLIIDDSGFLQVPRGGADERPLLAPSGGIRLNLDRNEIEFNAGEEWKTMQNRTDNLIVKDKLVFHIDSADPRSYPGIGNQMFNLAPYEYTGDILSLGNGSKFSKEFWDFSETGGTSGSIGGVAFPVSQISTDPSAFLGDPSGELTYEIWHYTKVFDPSDRLMATDRSDYHCLMWNDSSGTLEVSFDNVNFDITEYTFELDKWYHIVATCSRLAGSTDNIRVYANGILIATRNRSIRDPIGDGSVRPFGLNQNVEDEVDIDSGSQGYTSICRIYGKALSQDEVRQNYLAERWRHTLDGNL